MTFASCSRSRAKGEPSARRALGVTHSTVFRRLRHDRADRLNAAVRALPRRPVTRRRRPARQRRRRRRGLGIEASRALGASSRDRTFRPSGPVRITTTGYARAVLEGGIGPRCASAHPEITPEIVVSNAMANLTRREAEIAIRPTPAPSELHWSGTRRRASRPCGLRIARPFRPARRAGSVGA